MSKPRLKAVYDAQSPALRLWDLKRQLLTLRRFSKTESDLIDNNELQLSSNGSLAVKSGTRTLLAYTNPLTTRSVGDLKKVEPSNGSALSSNGKWLLHKLHVGAADRTTNYAKEVFTVSVPTDLGLAALATQLDTDLNEATPGQYLESLLAGFSAMPALPPGRKLLYVYGVKPLLAAGAASSYEVLPFSADKWSRYDATTYVLSYVPFHRVEFKRMYKVDNDAVSRLFYAAGNMDALIKCDPKQASPRADASSTTYCGLVRDPRCECLDSTSCMSSLIGSAHGSKAMYCFAEQAWKQTAANCHCQSKQCKLFESEDPAEATSFLYDARPACPSTLNIAVCNTSVQAGGNIEVNGTVQVKQQCGQEPQTYSCDSKLHACVPDVSSLKLLAQCNAECPKGGYACEDSGKCAWSASATDTQAECASKCSKAGPSGGGGYACDSKAGQCAWSASATDTQAECASKCSSSPPPAPPLSVGAIAGIASGGVVLIVIIGVLIYVFVIKKKAAAGVAGAAGASGTALLSAAK
jgi:hypothetical protein